VRLRALLHGRTNRRLLLLSLAAAAVGSGSLALLTAVLVLVETTRQARQGALWIERDLIVSLISGQSIQTLQRRLQLSTTAGELRQALVADQQGQVIVASDPTLIGRSITELASWPAVAGLDVLLRDCRPQALGAACLDRQFSRLVGPLPWIGGERLVRFAPTSLVLDAADGAARRGTLIFEVDLQRQLRQAASLALRAFLAGLLPLFVTCAVLVLVVRRRVLPELLNLAQTDSLSGVLNRRAFLETAAYRLERAGSLGQPVVVAVIDVDHFKTINDRFGHAVGDAVIQAMAALLESGVRRTDLVGRLGGDEFALLIEGAEAQARELLERLRHQVAAAPIRLPDGRQVAITLSIGMAASGRVAGEGLDAVLAAADTSLYRAKGLGRNRVISC
jgi:diguanylate cyclase (GGDEF)-like protein